MNLVNDVKRLKEDNLVLQKDLEVVFDGRYTLSCPKKCLTFFFKRLNECNTVFLWRDFLSVIGANFKQGNKKE